MKYQFVPPVQQNTPKNFLQRISFQTWMVIFLIIALFFMIGRELFRKNDNSYSDLLKQDIELLKKQRDSLYNVSDSFITLANKSLDIADSINRENVVLSLKLKQALVDIDTKQKRIDEVSKRRQELMEIIKQTTTKPILKEQEELLRAFDKYK